VAKVAKAAKPANQNIIIMAKVEIMHEKCVSGIIDIFEKNLE